MTIPTRKHTCEGNNVKLSNAEFIMCLATGRIRIDDTVTVTLVDGQLQGINCEPRGMPMQSLGNVMYSHASDLLIVKGYFMPTWDALPQDHRDFWDELGARLLEFK
jgi:hypothetical protein